MPRFAVPHTRLFVLGGKGVPEDDIKKVFEGYGTIEDVFKPKDRKTGEEKAVFYVTYSKASEAALALEELNGQTPFRDTNNRALKVVLAAEKSEGSKWDPKEDEKLVRLFIMCKKHESEKDLEDIFQEWGDVEHVNVLKDRSSGESRGLAYIKYYRPYHAALALENCPSEYKPKFAESKSKAATKRNNEEEAFSNYSSFRDDYGGNRDDRYGGHGGRGGRDDRYGDGYGDFRRERDTGRSLMGMMRGVSHQGSTVVEMVMPPVVTREQVYSLCDFVPGLTGVNYERSTGTFLATYSSPEAAAYAKDHLDGFEYPPGHSSIAAWFPTGLSRNSGSYDSRGPGNTALSGLASELRSAQGQLDSLGASSDSSNNLQFIAEFVKKASSILDNVASGSGGQSGGIPSIDEERVRYCNIPLPLPKPFAGQTSDCEQRLFIVSQPDPVPEYILQDIFCRFGGLITVYFMGGRNCGYAKFANKNSALHAIETLHGQQVYGNRFKVMLADPPPGDNDEPRAKKPRN